TRWPRDWSSDVCSSDLIVPRDPRTRAAPLEDAARTAVAAYQRAMDGYELEEGAAQWMDLAARANRYIQETVPWELRKAGKETERSEERRVGKEGGAGGW